MRRVSGSFLAAAAVLYLFGVPVGAHAQRTSYQISASYMTTEEAFNAYNAKSTEPPPQVQAYPVGVANVGFYFHYSGMKANKDTFRVGFTAKNAEVRHGSLHTFDGEAGEETLAIPAATMQRLGSYKATLYIDNVAAKSAGFKVIVTPKVSKAYMITEQQWQAFGPTSKNDPPAAASFAAGVSRVGVFYSYTGMAKTDVHYVGVYNNANGSQLHRSDDNTPQYVPSGALAILLPADAGRYPKGAYRTDLYIDHAMVKSITWAVK